MFIFTIAGCRVDTTELHSQKELSRTVGLFQASRYVLYKESDDHYYYFQETGKFGWLGPMAKFKISKDLIAIRKSAGDNDVITYDQNKGEFFVGTGPNEEVIKADFVEQYTREEEALLQAVKEASKFSKSDLSKEKISALNQAMMASYAASHMKEASQYAQELLELVGKKDFAQTPGDAAIQSDSVHTGNRILGLIAVKNGDIHLADSYLLASAKVSGSPVLGSFGPNMMLAQELLLAGEKQTVLEYLTLCEKFWKNDALQTWKHDIETNKTPNFGANLYY
jgi:hypothetical protein